MGIPLYTNNAATTLLAAITAGDGSLTVATGTGALFPSPTGSDYAWLTLTSSTGTEIIKCTSRSGDTFTVTRGQQSTAALPFAVGDALTLRITAAGLALVGDALTTNPLSQFAATTSAQLADVISDETGSGALVFADSPTLVTPALGTPSALVGTNITGTAAGLSIGGNAATVTVADAAGDTTTWVLLGTAQTGNLAPATNTGLVYNATTQTFSTVSALDSTAVFGSTSGTGVGVHGRVVGSGVGIGVYANGSTNGTGVHGTSGGGYGVRGVSTTNYGGSFSSIGTEGQITSTLATGTAPLVVASTTPVANLSIEGNAGTVTVADAAGDTTTWVLLGTAQTGNLAPATDAGLTYDATTNALTATTFVGALTGTASGNLTSGGALGTPSSGTLTSCSGLPVSGITASTSTAIGVGSIELGHASDTSITRVSAGVIAVEGINVVLVSATQTLTNKRNTKRITTEASSATPTINTDNCDIHQITALAVAITSMTTNLTGTPVNGDGLIIEITDNATGRAITWGASFEASTVALPTTTVASTKLTTGFMWNTTTSKWRCVGVA